MKRIWPEIKFGFTLYIVLFALHLCTFQADAQPPTQEVSKRIVASDFFKDEWGDNYGICEVPRLTAVTDVTGPFTGGQCLKRNSGNTAWVGGQCGTGGGQGFDFTSAVADQQHNWVFPIGQKPLTASINFNTGACPSGWGTACWSSEPRAIVGSYTSVNGGVPPSDIVLLSNTRIAYASASDKRAVAVWLGTTKYPVEFIAHNGLLGVRQVVYSTFQTQLPGASWRNARFEFSDGSFAPATEGTLVQRTADKEELVDYLGLTKFVPNQDNIYPVAKEILKGSVSADDTAKTITITGGSGGGGGPSEFIAFDNVPTDLTPFVNNQVLRINKPDPGKWMEVGGSNTQHGYKINGAFDPNNANNWGVSYFGDVYGSLSTEEGGQPLSATQSAIERFEITQNQGGDDTLTVLIKKADLATAPAIIYYRIYQKAVGQPGDELVTGSLLKGTDNTAHSYHTYLSPSGDGAANALWADTSDIKYVRFFSLNPATDNETSNPLNLHSAKTLYEIDTPTTVIGHRSLSVSQSQRILGFGQYRFVDQPTWNQTDPNTSYNIRQRIPLTNGEIIVIYPGSNTDLKQYKFIKYGIASNGSSGTETFISLDTGVTIPDDFIGINQNPFFLLLHDDSVLVYSGNQGLDTTTANLNLFTLTFNSDWTKITNIRKLSVGSLPMSSSFKRRQYTYIRGANHLYFYSYYIGGSNSGNSGYDYSWNVYFGKLNIGQTTSNIQTLFNFTTYTNFHRQNSVSYPWYDDDYIPGLGNSAQDGFYMPHPYQGTIQKGTYEYINIPTRSLYRYSYNYTYYYCSAIIKINKTTGTSPHLRFSIPDVRRGSQCTTTNNWRVLNNANVLLADGSYFYGNSITRFNFTENTVSPAVQDTEIASAITRDVSNISTFTNTYSTDGRTSTDSTYALLYSNQLTNGDIYTLATRNIYNGGTSVQSYKNTGFFFIPVSGDIQTTISRSFSSLLQNLSGHEVSVGATLPTASISGDTHVFDQDVASGLDWLDTDGTTALTSAELGDWAVYNGSKWVKKDFDVSGHSPQRVGKLPSASLSKEEEDVYVTASYNKANGFDITPQNFTNTEIGGEGYGARGWYSDPQLDYDVGRLSPDDSEIEDVYLISDTMVLIKTGQLSTLTHIAYGSTECALTKGMTDVAVSGADQRKVDQWGIAGSCAPAGDWDDVRFKKSDGTYIPAQVSVPKGRYTYLNNDWVESGFFAKEVQPDKSFKVAIEEERPGTRQDKNLPFTQSGSTLTTTNPFPGVLRITYNNLSTDTDTYQRYTVFVPLDGFEDSKAPSVLDTGTVNYSLHYFETDAGQAVYRTAKVKSTEAQTSDGTRNGMNVGFLDGSWAGQSAVQRTRRVATRTDLAHMLNSVQGVHKPPTNPVEGTRIEMLNDYTIQGGAVLTAAESSGSTQAGVSITGLFVGFESGR